MIQRKRLFNGFEYVEVQNASASAKIALNGAHIFHYARVGEKPLLWLSEISDFEVGRSIRGGIPVCWPWFGMHRDESLPQHGFARTSMWELLSAQDRDEQSSEVILQLTDSEESLKLWPYRFRLELRITIAERLTLELITTNSDDKSFIITQALHTYFDISHIKNVSIRGLEKKPYLDALTYTEKIQNGDITFDQEVDRVYQKVDGEILLDDTTRTIHIKNEGSSSVVVWNPWIEKCKRMSAMRDDAYMHMVCIESANALDDYKRLRPKESHTLKATIY